jgi:hypothetical protein
VYIHGVEKNINRENPCIYESKTFSTLAFARQSFPLSVRSRFVHKPCSSASARADTNPTGLGAASLVHSPIY